MKYVNKLIIVILLLIQVDVFAGEKEKAVKDSVAVNGNCAMCKKNIEAAVDLKGVKWAEWNVEKHMLYVEYLPSKISMDKIQQEIANAGYDTEKYKAPDAAYKKLHACCKYDR